MRLLSLAAFPLIGALACAPRPALLPDGIQVRVGSIDREELEAGLRALPRSYGARSDWMAGAFREAGCLELALHFIPGTRGTESVLCTLPGHSDSTVVVTANMDRPHEGHGLIDNGTGMVLLPLLYSALGIESRRHTFVFAGFADALRSQLGSRRYLRNLTDAERSKIRALVQLKALGVGSPAMWGSRADPELRQDLFSVSRALDIELRSTRFHGDIAVDAKSFRAWGIPTITVHSMGRSSAKLLHHPIRDRHVDRIDWQNYREAARLIAVYLAYLDRTLVIRRAPESSGAEPL